jgi:hypothetical protein
MAWDGDSKNAVNTHFGIFGDVRRAFEYMGALTIDDVFRSVILATLKSSNNRALRTVYDQILDDLDDHKDLTFAHIQTVCARQFRRTKERHPDPPHSADTPRATPRTSPVKTERNTTSTSIKEVTTSPPSSATPLKNIVNSLGRFSAEPASLAPSGTSPLQSPLSSWPPRNTSPVRSPLTQTMTMTPTMTLTLPMNRMIEPEDHFVFVGRVRGLFFLSLYVSYGILRGGHVTHSLCSLPGLASYCLNQL